MLFTFYSFNFENSIQKFIFFILLTLNISSFGQIKNDTLVQFVSSKVDSMPNGFVVSIAIIKNDEIKYLGITKENNEIHLQDLRDSLFEIGSLTKIFTSTLLAHEVTYNNLKMTSYVNKSFPFKFKNNIKLTYISLANHTSGLYRLPINIMPLMLKNPDNPYAEYSYDLFDHYLQEDLQIDASENPKYSYSNLGAGLLAYSLSKRSSKPFEILLNENIFSKYNMSKTAFDIKTSFAGINVNNQKTSNWQLNSLKGAGGLVSSTYDLSKFIIAQFDDNNPILSLTRKITHSISDDMSIGLGWHIVHPNNSNLKYWHNGGTGGFTSSISFRTVNKTGVIVLSNISAAHKQSNIIDELCFELLDLLK